MSERQDRKKGQAPRADAARRPAGKPDGRRPFVRTASPARPGERRQGPYGRPAPKPAGEGRPAGERRSAQKPGEAPRGPYGRPAPRPEGEARPAGDRKPFARPAGGPTKPVGRYGRPAGTASRPLGERRSFGRPAPRPPVPVRPAPPSVSSDARRAALRVLNHVLLDQAYASLSLDEQLSALQLSYRDRRLCTQLVYLTLENLHKLDYALDRLLQDPERLEKRVRNLLRLSAAQIMLLDRVPDSAAVNEAVKITRDMGLEELTGVVNGVLRSLIRQMDSIPWPEEKDGLLYYEVMYSQPRWLAERILRDYGQEEGDRILRFRRERQRVTLRPNLSRISAEDFRALLDKKGWRAEPGLLPNAWHVQGVGDISRDEDFQAGSFTVQGEGSMVAALAMDVRLGNQVLDCCAAPGGKAAYLAEIMQGTGRIQAWDLHEHRVKLIQALVDRLRIYSIRPAVRDALVYREQLDRMMDAVIIDAPCTGTGVMDEKPDIRLRIAEEGLLALVETQRKLLSICSRYVKPGGTLVYATCSILPEENEQQVEAFLKENEGFRMDPLPESIPAVLRGQAGPYGLQLLPHRDGTEGFFIARMKRL